MEMYVLVKLSFWTDSLSTPRAVSLTKVRHFLSAADTEGMLCCFVSSPLFTFASGVKTCLFLCNLFVQFKKKQTKKTFHLDNHLT